MHHWEEASCEFAHCSTSKEIEEKQELKLLRFECPTKSKKSAPNGKKTNTPKAAQLRTNTLY